MFQERTFEIERESIYDFICNTLCPAFHCIAVFDTVNNTINFYPEDENDETGDFDSDIYISFDNLATEMKVEYSADDIKTVLKVTGDSELDIRTVNLGSAALTDLSWFHTRERMGDDLYEKYAQYVEYCAEKSIQYEELWEEYDALYSEKLILENKIPSSDFVLKLGDYFEKLYCIYYPVYADDASQSEIDSAVDTSISALTEKLRMYHLNDTTNARTDSVLLTLKNNNLSATFRLIYDNGSYSIRLIITDPDASTTIESIYTIEEWVRGEISIASKAAALNGYSISYIGTLGAFFCIAKDETKPATLQEYGLNLLMTERKKYQTVQSVQVSGGLAETSNRFDDDDFERMMSETPHSYPGQGVLWLDRSTTPSTILVYKNGSWVVPTSASDIRYAPKDYENFIRYLDNLVKLYCINQEIAVRQQQISELNVQITLNGVRRSDITASCEMATFFTPDEYKRLSYFLREDEYNDTSFVTTQYMTEQEVQSVKHALLDAGKKELSKLCAPQLKFSASIANIMAIPAFAALLSQFELGKFVHVELRDDFIKVVRLLQVDVNFFSLDDFTCTFGDMLESKNQADIHAELLAQATTMAKSVAANSSNWQKAATQASEIDNKITDGLISANTALKTNAVDQAIEWNDTGFHLRKWKDESRTEYDDLQGWLTNNGIYFTSDGWKSSDPLYSKFTVNGVEYTGVIAKAVIGGLLSGTYIEGGEIDIGNGNFKVTADGKVSMKAAEIENYINSSDFSEVTGKMMYRVELYSSGPTLFTDPNQQTTLFCKVYSWDDDITDDLNASLFTWKYNSGTSSADEVFATGVKTITVNSSKINKNSRFYCEVNL